MFSEVKSRWKAPTPKFFKKVQVFGASVAGFGLSLTQIPHIPATLIALGTNAIVAGGVIVLVAKLAIQNVADDAPISEPKMPDNVQS